MAPGAVDGLSVDVLLEVLARSEHEHYGENVHMLDHALQAAALARADGASDALIVAALVHDVGHLLGEAGQWGLPSHAEVGAAWLASAFGPEVTEPVRLHVEAKRWLVATDASYMNALSLASQESLVEQGGPHTKQECEQFAAQPGARDAARLRRWDDGAKLDPATANVPGLASYRNLLVSLMGSRSQVSGTWARDACRCPSCRDPRNDQHLLTAEDLVGWAVVGDPVPGGAVPGQAMTVTVRRDDGTEHTCEIPEQSAQVVPLEPLLWGADHRFGAGVDAEDPDALRQIATAVDRYGIAVVRNVEPISGAVLTFAERLGFVRETNYGALFDVVSEPDAQNLAYTSLGLPLHSDNPYRDPAPTVQLLHCLRPAQEGGASRFSDGFRAAAALRRTEPAAFELLASAVCSFRYHGGSAALGQAVDLVAHRPIIEVGPDGVIAAVSLNHRSMEAPLPGQLGGRHVDDFYRAYQRLNALVSAADAVVDYRLEAGELVVFDNRRVLHARTAFTDDGGRHLQGCYIDIDAIRSTAATSRPPDSAPQRHDLVVEAVVGASPVRYATGAEVDVTDSDELGLTDRLVLAFADWAQFFSDVEGDLSEADVAEEFVGQAFKLAHKLRGELKGSTVHLVHPVTGEQVEIVRTTPR